MHHSSFASYLTSLLPMYLSESTTILAQATHLIGLHLGWNSLKSIKPPTIKRTPKEAKNSISKTQTGHPKGDR